MLWEIQGSRGVAFLELIEDMGVPALDVVKPLQTGYHLIHIGRTFFCELFSLQHYYSIKESKKQKQMPARSLHSKINCFHSSVSFQVSTKF